MSQNNYQPYAKEEFKMYLSLRRSFYWAILIGLTVFLQAAPSLSAQDPSSLSAVQPSSLLTGKVTLCFDDGTLGYYQYAAPILQKYGLKGVASVIINYLNNPSARSWMMSWDQARDLQDKYGWEIASKTISNLPLTNYTDPALPLAKGISVLVKELRDAKDDLIKNGINVKTVVLPNDDVDDTVLSYVSQYYQSISFGSQSHSTPANYRRNTKNIIYFTPVATVKKWIDTAKAQNQWLILKFFNIVPDDVTPSFYVYPISKLDAICSYLKNNNIPVVTISEALK